MRIKDLVTPRKNIDSVIHNVWNIRRIFIFVLLQPEYFSLLIGSFHISLLFDKDKRKKKPFICLFLLIC